jgi:hypothetical protein
MSKSKRNKRVYEKIYMAPPEWGPAPLFATIPKENLKTCPGCGTVCSTPTGACRSSGVHCPECGISFCPYCNKPIIFKRNASDDALGLVNGDCDCGNRLWIRILGKAL